MWVKNFSLHKVNLLKNKNFAVSKFIIKLKTIKTPVTKLLDNNSIIADYLMQGFIINLFL